VGQEDIMKALSLATAGLALALAGTALAQQPAVPPETPIVTCAPADKSELKAGAQIIIFGAQKQPDGTLQAQAVNVCRGVTPPM
jgi:hypothetical protein